MSRQQPTTGSASRSAGVRLQKLLAPALGISRRQADEWIENGRVTLGNRTAKPGDLCPPGAQIRVDGRPIVLDQPAPCRVLAYHKAIGQECSRRPSDGRVGVFDRLPPLKSARWLAAGRLDVTTSGLLLLTTDGDLAHHLMHPSSGFDREYLVRLRGHPPNDVLERLVRGVRLEDGPARFADLAPGPQTDSSNRWYCVTLMEGRNRLIHRLWESQGYTVSRLRRIRFGPVWLPRGLSPGSWRELTAEEVDQLKNWPKKGKKGSRSAT